jgi:hypothetical protein
VKVQAYRSIDIEDVPNVPQGMEWITDYMAPVHEQLRILTSVLQSGVSVDNLAAELRVVSMKEGQAVTIELQQIKGKPIGAVPLSSTSPIDAFLVEGVDVGKIKLTGFFENETSAVSVTVLILGV